MFDIKVNKSRFVVHVGIEPTNRSRCRIPAVPFPDATLCINEQNTILTHK